MKIVIILIMSISILFSTDIKQPVAEFKSSGSVVDIVYVDGLLYSATNVGCVDIFDFKTRKIVEKIEVEKITDFMGDLIDSKVYSVDVLNDKVLVLSQDRQGFRRVHIYKENDSKLIIDASMSLSIAKAKFLDSNTLLLALLSNEIISYDIKEHKQNWLIQVSGAKFSNFVLSEDKTEVVIADESGDLKIHNTKNGSLIKTLAGQNLDNVFQVDYKNHKIATAGQDRRVVIYDTKLNSSYYKSSSFLIYSVGLSPSGTIVGYSSDENNNVSLFDTYTQSPLGVFGGNKMTLTNILFINENEFLVSNDSSIINLYRIK